MEPASSFRSNWREEPNFDIKEWDRKAKIIRRSRKFSGSNLREDAKSLTSSSSSSGITISSTVSSPGYNIMEEIEIDPLTYSFTTALKALQAKNSSPYGGYTLNSKWSDAEKYICNPLSGQVPYECLSTKALRERSSFRSLSNRITLSASPLIGQSQPVKEHEQQVKLSIREKKKESMARDIGIQSTMVDLSSGSPSPAKTPSIEGRSIKKVDEDSSLSSEQLNTEEETGQQQVVQEAKETSDDHHDHDEQKITEKNAKKKVRRKLPKMIMMMMLCCKREKESCSCLSIKKERKQTRIIEVTNIQ